MRRDRLRPTDAALWNEYREDCSVKLRNKIALQNDRLALEVAHRMTDVGLPFEDLAQLARIGLIRAVERFDPGKRVAFSSFAVPYIKGEILHFLRDHGSMLKIPRQWREIYAKGQRVVKERRSLHPECTLTTAQIAQAIGIRESFWIQITEGIQLQSAVSLDEPLNNAEWRSPDPDAEDKITWKNLVRLPDPYRTALAESVFQGRSVVAIARRFKVPPAEVQQWIETGLDRLKSLEVAA